MTVQNKIGPGGATNTVTPGLTDWKESAVSDATCSIEGCDRAHIAKGFCPTHYMRKARTGDPLGRIPRRTMTAEETHAAFWQKVEKTETCWNWVGGKDQQGYGQLRTGGKMVKAHRWAYETEREPIPDGLVADHMCHNVACVNPDHIRVVPPAVNARNRTIQHNNTTGVTGVHVKRLRSGAVRYVADARIDGKRVHLGTFGTVEEAATVATAAREKHYQYPTGQEFQNTRARAVRQEKR